MKRRTRPNRIGNGRRAALRRYAAARAAFLARPENHWCRVFLGRRATEVHHTRGRAGRFLLDERCWVPVSRAGHRWIHENTAEARRLGWLGPWLRT